MEAVGTVRELAGREALMEMAESKVEELSSDSTGTMPGAKRANRGPRRI